MLFAHGAQPSEVTIGYVNPEKILVCEDSSACRRRAIEIMRAYLKMQRGA